MNLEQAQERIAELERRVTELERRLPVVASQPQYPWYPNTPGQFAPKPQPPLPWADVWYQARRDAGNDL